MKANSDSHLPGFFSLMSFIVKANYQLTGAHKRNKQKKNLCKIFKHKTSSWERKKLTQTTAKKTTLCAKSAKFSWMIFTHIIIRNTR